MNPPVRPEIAAMQGYVPGEQPQTSKVIKLNTNENPYPCSPRVLQAIAAACESGLARYPDPMATSFRRRAAELLQVPPEWILCGNGSDDILTILTRTFVGQGEVVRYPYPSYLLYRTLAEIQGARCDEVSFDAQWSLDSRFWSTSESPSLAFLANPNSPSGTVISPEQVLEIARRLPCPLVVDEAYVDFAEDHCVRLVEQCDKILVTRSLSKSYALAGLRFGFIVAQPQWIEQLVKVKDSYNCDTLAIAGATAAIDDQQWLRNNRQRILDTRQRMTAELQQLGFHVQPSQANFVWCTEGPRAAREIYEALKTQGVYVRYMSYPGWPEGLRISVGTDAQIDVLLEMLRGLV